MSQINDILTFSSQPIPSSQLSSAYSSSQTSKDIDESNRRRQHHREFFEKWIKAVYPIALQKQN